MKHPILILLTIFGPSSVFATPPDICAEDVYRNVSGAPLTDSIGTQLSRYCKWTGPATNLWAGDTCCSIDTSGANCVVPDKKRGCDAGFERFYCKYGERLAGGFVCYQPFPSACMAEDCSGPPAGYDVSPGPAEDVICCIGGICYPWDELDYEDCSGEYKWCDDGYSMVDGTVECFD